MKMWRSLFTGHLGGWWFKHLPTIKQPPQHQSWEKPPLGWNFHPRREGSSKAWSKSCLLSFPGGPLAGSVLTKSLHTQSHGWAVGDSIHQSSELESSQGMAFLHWGISVIGWVGWEKVSSFISPPSSLFLLFFYSTKGSNFTICGGHKCLDLKDESFHYWRVKKVLRYRFKLFCLHRKLLLPTSEIFLMKFYESWYLLVDIT